MLRASLRRREKAISCSGLGKVCLGNKGVETDIVNACFVRGNTNDRTLSHPASSTLITFYRRSLFASEKTSQGHFAGFCDQFLCPWWRSVSDLARPLLTGIVP